MASDTGGTKWIRSIGGREIEQRQRPSGHRRRPNQSPPMRRNSFRIALAGIPGVQFGDRCRG